jgi:chemotaxis signal transduction protein
MSATEPDADGEADDPTDHVEFLLFTLDGASYALELGRVRQTMEVPQTSRVPNAPALVEGVASVAGDVVVVLDGRTVTGASQSREGDREPMLLLLDHGGPETMEELGVVVDDVEDVATVHVDRVRPPDAIDAPDGAGRTRGDDRWFRAVIVPDESDAEAPPATYVLDVVALVEAASA